MNYTKFLHNQKIALSIVFIVELKYSWLHLFDAFPLSWNVKKFEFSHTLHRCSYMVIWSYNIPSLKTQDIHVIGSKNGHVPYQKPFSSFLTPSIFDCHFNLAIWRHYYFICQPFVTYPLVYCYKYLAISWVSTFRECSSRKPVGHKFDIEEREKRILRSEIPSDKTIFQPDWKHFRTILESVH